MRFLEPPKGQLEIPRFIDAVPREALQNWLAPRSGERNGQFFKVSRIKKIAN